MSDASTTGLAAGPTGQTGPVPAVTKIRRRNRLINSCFECRRRKLKCDKDHPCLNCSKANRECIFIGPANDAASKSRLTAIKERVGTLERLLELDILRGAGRDVPPQDYECTTTEDGNGVAGQEPDDEKGLEPTPWALSDAAYDDDADDDICDLGVKVGKMQVTERIGGYFRPRIAEELDLAEEGSDDYQSNDGRSASPEGSSFESSLDSSALKPSTAYTPSSGFLFGLGPGQSSLLDYLPTKAAADILVRQYFLAVHPVARAVHRPSFEATYRRFWAEIRAGVEPPASTQALVFAAMLSGAVSMNEGASLNEFGLAQESMVDTLRVGCEQALARAKFLKSTKMETLQALVMYLIPLCRDQVFRAHSALTATAIRIAQCIGLQRDGETYGLSAVEVHVRRLVWHQLCFLDIRACEAHGPQPAIREEDFDTCLPMNVDDAELTSCRSKSAPAERWTDVTLSLIRFECTAMMRRIWVDRPRLEKKQITLTSILAKIEGFRMTMEAKYLRFAEQQNPIQRMGKLVLALLVSRMFIMVLHRYHTVNSHDLPDRLRQIILTTGTEQLEIAMELETSPQLSPWAWYTGAYLQYHTALLLLTEVAAFPMRREADRIWRCLDYVFEVEPLQSRTEKTRVIFNQIRNRSAAYQRLRKVRMPTSMADLRSSSSNASASPREPMHSHSQSQCQSPALQEAKLPHLRFDRTRSPGVGLLPQFYYVPTPNAATTAGSASASTMPSISSPTSSIIPTISSSTNSAMPTTNASTSSAHASTHTSANTHALPSPAGIGVGNINVNHRHGNNSTSQPMTSSPSAWNVHGTLNGATTNYGSNAGYFNLHHVASSTNAIPEIDWNEWNMLFPPHINNGQLDISMP